MGEWSTRVIGDLRSTVALGIDRNLVAYGCGCGVSRTRQDAGGCSESRSFQLGERFLELRRLGGRRDLAAEDRHGRDGLPVRFRVVLVAHADVGAGQ